MYKVSVRASGQAFQLLVNSKGIIASVETRPYDDALPVVPHPAVGNRIIEANKRDRFIFLQEHGVNLEKANAKPAKACKPATTEKAVEALRISGGKDSLSAAMHLLRKQRHRKATTVVIGGKTVDAEAIPAPGPEIRHPVTGGCLNGIGDPGGPRTVLVDGFEVPIVALEAFVRAMPDWKARLKAEPTAEWPAHEVSHDRFRAIIDERLARAAAAGERFVRRPRPEEPAHPEPVTLRKGTSYTVTFSDGDSRTITFDGRFLRIGDSSLIAAYPSRQADMKRAECSQVREAERLFLGYTSYPGTVENRCFRLVTNQIGIDMVLFDPETAEALSRPIVGIEETD